MIYFQKNLRSLNNPVPKIIEETFEISSQKLSVTQVFTSQMQILRLSML